MSMSIIGATNMAFPPMWEPTTSWVIIGRGQKVKQHNADFVKLVNNYTESYSAAKTKQDKSIILNQIVEKVHENGGGFVKRDLAGRCYIVVEDSIARTTIAQALRDQLGPLFRSSRSSKVNKRLQKMSTAPEITLERNGPPIRCVSPFASQTSTPQTTPKAESKPVLNMSSSDPLSTRYEHSRRTSARASAIYDYLLSGELLDELSHLPEKDDLECDFELFQFD